jgi:hypothetical protein
MNNTIKYYCDYIYLVVLKHFCDRDSERPVILLKEPVNIQQSNKGLLTNYQSIN